MNISTATLFSALVSGMFLCLMAGKFLDDYPNQALKLYPLYPFGYTWRGYRTFIPFGFTSFRPGAPDIYVGRLADLHYSQRDGQPSFQPPHHFGAETNSEYGHDWGMRNNVNAESRLGTIYNDESRHNNFVDQRSYSANEETKVNINEKTKINVTLIDVHEDGHLKHKEGVPRQSQFRCCPCCFCP